VLESFTIETFSKRLGERFALDLGDAHRFDVELVEATPLGSAPPQGRAPFSIVFRGVSQPVLPQRIYRVEHDALGGFELFLVPIGPDGSGMRYEAVFG
jgi:hypothetical protein